MKRMDIILDLTEWIEDNDYSLTIDQVIEEQPDLTDEEIFEIENFISKHEWEEEMRIAEEEAEQARIAREYKEHEESITRWIYQGVA